MSGDRFLRLLTQQADLKRITSYAYNDTPVGGTGITFSRSTDFYAEGVLTGFSDGTGSVEVIGLNSSGDSVSVSISFAGNYRKMDSNTSFRSIAYINTAGLTGESVVGNLQVNAVSRTGQPVEEFTTIRTNIPVRFSALRDDEVIANFGSSGTSGAKVFMGTDGDVDRRDKLVFRGVSYNIQGIRMIMSRESIRDHRVLLVASGDEL